MNSKDYYASDDPNAALIVVFHDNMEYNPMHRGEIQRMIDIGAFAANSPARLEHTSAWLPLNELVLGLTFRELNQPLKRDSTSTAKHWVAYSALVFGLLWLGMLYYDLNSDLNFQRSTQETQEKEFCLEIAELKKHNALKDKECVEMRLMLDDAWVKQKSEADREAEKLEIVEAAQAERSELSKEKLKTEQIIEKQRDALMQAQAASAKREKEWVTSWDLLVAENVNLRSDLKLAKRPIIRTYTPPPEIVFPSEITIHHTTGPQLLDPFAGKKRAQERNDRETIEILRQMDLADKEAGQ